MKAVLSRLRLLPLLAFSAGAAAQSATLEPARIYSGDVSVLVIEQRSKIPSLYAIDTAELERDFVILDAKSRVYRVVEGQESGSRMQWRLELLPRRSGRLRIPALKLGDSKTPPRLLEVLPLPAQAAQRPEIFVELETTAGQPYVGQRINLIMRLLYRSAVFGGRWLEPEAAGAEVLRSINESNYRTTRDGETYNVLERELTMFAQSPGTLKISPAGFHGRIDPAEDPLALYRGQEFRLLYRRSRGLQLNVREIPPTFGGAHWLPARDLQLQQTWEGITPDLRPGDSIRRNLRIVASGLSADVLPADQLFESAAGYRVYPDRERRASNFDQQNLIGRLEQSYAIVVNTSGIVELPAIELVWWDVDLERERTARLPGKTLVVSPATDAGDGIPTAALPVDAKPDAAHSRRRLALLAVICALMLTAASMQRPAIDFVLRKLAPWRRRRRLWQDLRQACRDDDPQRARQCLIAWARGQWPATEIAGLSEIAALADTRKLETALNELDAALYAAAPGAWRGAGLWRALRALQRSKRPRERALRGLPRFYPLPLNRAAASHRPA